MKTPEYAIEKSRKASRPAGVIWFKTYWWTEKFVNSFFDEYTNYDFLSLLQQDIIPDVLTLMGGIYSVAGDEGWSKDCPNIKDC